MNDLIAHIPKALRWILFLPGSLAAGCLVAGLIRLISASGAGASSGPTAYAAAFLSGLVYVWAALHVAHWVAPSHKRIAVLVLGLLILADLGLIHLVLQADLMLQAAVSEDGETPIAVVCGFLRADDYSGLQKGGLVKYAGVLLGGYVVWRKYIRNRRPQPDVPVASP